MPTVYAMGIPVKKGDGQCAHPSCQASIDWTVHDKPPVDWGTITFTRYGRKNAAQQTLIVCPKHTLSFTDRQPKLSMKIRPRTRVVIESPFAGNWEKNLRYLRAAMRDCLLKNEAPYASHALYTQEGVLDDNNPDERKLGMESGFLWGEAAHKVVVYTDLGVSGGMQAGIERANERGQVVERRKLMGEWSDGGSEK